MEEGQAREIQGKVWEYLVRHSLQYKVVHSVAIAKPASKKKAVGPKKSVAPKKAVAHKKAVAGVGEGLEEIASGSADDVKSLNFVKKFPKIHHMNKCSEVRPCQDSYWCSFHALPLAEQLATVFMTFKTQGDDDDGDDDDDDDYFLLSDNNNRKTQ